MQEEPMFFLTQNILTRSAKFRAFKQIGIKIEKVDGKKAKELAEKARNKEIEYYDREDPISTAYREHTAEDLTGSVQAR